MKLSPPGNMAIVQVGLWPTIIKNPISEQTPDNIFSRLSGLDRFGVAFIYYFR